MSYLATFRHVAGCLSHSNPRLRQYGSKCGEVTWQALILHPIPRLGGPGVIIQIDESKFNHKSKVSKKGLNTLVSAHLIG